MQRKKSCLIVFLLITQGENSNSHGLFFGVNKILHTILSFTGVMKICNSTELTSMDPNLYNMISLITICLACVGNMLLTVPLLVAISRSPSLLGKARFLLLFHLLCCDNLQLLVLLVRKALLTSHLMLVTHCVVFMSANLFLSMVALFLRAGLSVDRCLAICLPLRYEMLLSPVRQRVAVVLMWASALLLSMVGMGMVLDRVWMNVPVPHCSMARPCLSDHGPVRTFFTTVSALVLPLSFATVLCCFVLLCCHSKGRLCSEHRACVTLTMQAVQMVIHAMGLVLNTWSLLTRVHNAQWDLAIGTIYTLGISLISLVYGYRSKELRCRLLKPQVCNQVSTCQ